MMSQMYCKLFALCLRILTAGCGVLSCFRQLLIAMPLISYVLVLQGAYERADLQQALGKHPNATALMLYGRPGLGKTSSLPEEIIKFRQQVCQ